MTSNKNNLQPTKFYIKKSNLQFKFWPLNNFFRRLSDS